MIRHLVAVVAALTCVGQNEILSNSRLRHVADARHLAIWLAAYALGWSSTAVGQVFGLDHTSVLYAKKRVDRLRASDPRWADLTDNARQLFELRRTAVRLKMRNALQQLAAEAQA